MKGIPQEKKVAQPFREIQKIEQKREERRVKMEEAKKEKQEKKAYNLASGKNVDIDFEIMIEKSRFKQKVLAQHISSADIKLAVCIRKRPIFKKQEANGEIDAISCANPQVKIHEPKYRVDGITKYVQNHKFTFDNTFNEQEGAEDIYEYALHPLVPLLFNDGVVTCFAYGQTGSGKTFTMNELQNLVVKEMYEMIGKGSSVCVSFFQIYQGRCLDLLNNKEPLNVYQDQKNSIQIPDLSERMAPLAEDLLKIMQEANSTRTTHATAANETSSRSHAICQVLVKNSNNKQIGKLLLVDLAGSERAGDTKSNNQQRRMEGAEINTSLLALKECIRAMDEKADHVPFRASKLTLILRDSFIAKQSKSKIVMIACISPGSSSSDHSLNTLRYADRLKDNTEASKKYDHLDIVRADSREKQKENFREEIQQRIGSSKNIPVKKDQSGTPARGSRTPKKTEKRPNQNNPPVQNKIPANLPKNVKREEPSQAPSSVKKIDKSKSVKKIVDPVLKEVKDPNKGTNQFSYNKRVERNSNISEIHQQIEGMEMIKQDGDRKRFKQDYDAMKETLQGVDNREQMLALTAKVANVLEDQEEVFATHMAAIKQDAKLLTQESQLISMIQGVGFIDYDIDNYVEKLEGIIKKKMKMYTLLARKVDKFKKCLKEEDEMHHNFND